MAEEPETFEQEEFSPEEYPQEEGAEEQYALEGEEEYNQEMYAEQGEEEYNQQEYDENQEYQEYQENYDDYYNYDEYYNYDYSPNIFAWSQAIYDYEAQTEEEISFSVGDIIGLIEERDDGWSVGENQYNPGFEGLFPSQYVQKMDTYDPNETKDKDEEATQRRKENREKLKGQMKKLKEELSQEVKERQKIEKEIKELNAQKQKMKKDLGQMKASMSDRSSLVNDLLQLGFSIEVHSDQVAELQAPTHVTIESLTQFGNDLQKEGGKSSSPLHAFATNTGKKLKQLHEQMQTCQNMLEESEIVGKEFLMDLETFVKEYSKKETLKKEED